ncbi:helix-turn-helix domain-containing protein [Micromonospora rubida]|uniref:Helix-turn-helix domain-containing protein n=1 Tax=Micromonospora rubida TaxID=2697657 RepID=A0ABW7SGP7_9ACTN
MSDHPVPDPATAGSPAEFVALLRQVRERSGLTYRQIQRRAGSTRQPLPASTLHTMLGRNTLPRQELVVALLVATGADDPEVSRWVDARRGLLLRQQTSGESVASGTEAGADPGGNDRVPPPASGRPRRWLLTTGAVAVTVTAIVAASLGAAHLVGRDGSAPSQPPKADPAAGTGSGLPANGFYRIRVAHSDRCLSERPEAGNGNIYQADCGRIFVDRALDRIDGRYLIRTVHPQEGPGCMGVQDASTAVGGIVSDDFCTEPDAKEFTLEPVTAPLAGFRIRPTHSDLCLGVLDASVWDWAPIQQEACDSTARGQVFRFDSAPPPASTG